MKFGLLFSLAVIILHAVAMQPEDSPGFFLKVTKNVPRLGRRAISDFEKYFMKASKSVPRIGRRDQFPDPNVSIDPIRSWYEPIPSPSKKMTGSPELDQLSSYHLIQPLDSNNVYDVLARDILNNHKFRFVAWKDFDRALEEDAELYRKLIAIGKDANLNLPGNPNFKQFVPLYGDTANNDLLYYRTDRDVGPQRGDMEKM